MLLSKGTVNCPTSELCKLMVMRITVLFNELIAR